MKNVKTRLDRLHQTMLLHAAGRGEAVRRLIVEEGFGNDNGFWELAQALSALYPKSSEEKDQWTVSLQERKVWAFNSVQYFCKYVIFTEEMNNIIFPLSLMVTELVEVKEMGRSEVK